MGVNIHEKIIELKRSIDVNYMKLGGYLKVVNEMKLYSEVDCKSFDEYIAQPELAFERSTVYSIMGVYADFIESGLSEVLDIAGIPYYKLDRIRQFKELPQEEFNEWIGRARELSLSDLNDEINLSNGKDAEPDYNSATKWFAKKMEEALEVNSWKTPWEEEEPKVLFGKALRNLHRLRLSTDKEKNIKNLIDTANYCMFIADKLRRE